jgi:hypothetical protein
VKSDGGVWIGRTRRNGKWWVSGLGRQKRDRGCSVAISNTDINTDWSFKITKTITKTNAKYKATSYPVPHFKLFVQLSAEARRVKFACCKVSV